MLSTNNFSPFCCIERNEKSKQAHDWQRKSITCYLPLLLNLKFNSLKYYPSTIERELFRPVRHVPRTKKHKSLLAASCNFIYIFKKNLLFTSTHSQYTSASINSTDRKCGCQCFVANTAIRSQLENLISRSFTRLIHHPSYLPSVLPIISFN
jgi:hypothetical protein